MTDRVGGRGTAIVTGAGRGIGAAIAERLARDGMDLILLDSPVSDPLPSPGYQLSTPEDLQRSAAVCRAHGAQVSAVSGDVRDPDTLRAALEPVVADRLYVAVAAAGVMSADKPAWEFTAAELDRDLATNFHGVANLARAAVPGLLLAPKGRGRFVAVVSTAGEVGLPRLAGYVASKHAALGYVRSLAADLGATGVTANAVLPGSTRTAMLERSAAAYGLDDVETFATHQRLGRLLEPGEIADAVGWLCSPGASAITGATVRVDGGFVG